MIVTEHFVFLHNFRSGGTYLNKFLMDRLNGRFIGYHLPRDTIPVEYEHLPIIVSVRNPWDWYVSVYYHCMNFCPPMMTPTFLNQITRYSRLPFVESITKSLNLEWLTTEDREKVLSELPTTYAINNSLMDNILRKDVENYIDNYKTQGMYSWYIERMFGDLESVIVCKNESLSLDFFNAMKDLKVPLSDTDIDLLLHGDRLNELRDYNSYFGKVKYPRKLQGYRGYFSKELKSLIAERDYKYIKELGYVW